MTVQEDIGLGNQQPSTEDNHSLRKIGRPRVSKGVKNDDPAYPHGTASGYKYCKCDVCRKHNADRKRNLNAAYRQKPGHKAMQKALNVAHRSTAHGLAIRRAHNAARKAAMRLSAVPADVRSLIVRIYANCPSGFQVDHIVPLARGGRHEPANLQYLPAEVNNAKRAKLDHDVSAHVLRWQDVLAEGSTTIPQGSRAKRPEVPGDRLKQPAQDMVCSHGKP